METTMTGRENDTNANSIHRQSEGETVDWQDYGQPMVGIIHAIASATGTDPEQVPDLTAIDGDAVNTFLRTAAEGNRNRCNISFVHNGHRITAWATGNVAVEPAPSSD